MNKNIKIQATDKLLSSFGGLKIFETCWTKLRQSCQFANFIPKTQQSLKKFEDLALGFAASAECLDDMGGLAQDQGFLAVCEEKVYTPKTYGDYLREFSSYSIDEGNKVLAQSAYAQRAQLEGKKIKSITFDFDSTTNRQYADVMEGVCYSHEKGYSGLTTMYVFDELGNQYYSDVRSGNMHTSHKVSKIIHLVLSQMPVEGSYASEEVYLPWQKSPYIKEIRIYIRADAGYSNKEFLNACFAKNVGFVLRLHGNMLEPLIKNISNWKPTKTRLKKSKKRDGKTKIIDKSIRFYDGRPTEIGSTFYFSPNIAKPCRVVCLRAKKPDTLGLTDDDYDYFAWLTNIGEHEMDNEKLIFFYRKRGHAENYIRELKNGYDMHHYPCLKLNANRAYALIAAFAHNILRFISLKENRFRPQFAKAIRNKFINLPCQVVRTGRQVIFKFMEHHRKEVERFLNKIKNLHFGFP